MNAMLAAARALGSANAALLALGRWLGATCLGVMVVVILIQVLFRYGLGDALSWTEEASRFLMLWMTGLMAPTAFRRGGFVGIDMIARLLPRAVAATLSLLLLLVSAVVLWQGARIGWAEATGIGGRFAMPALSVPTSLDFSTWTKVPRAWMMTSLAVGVTAMLLVNVELLLRAVVALLGGAERLAPIPFTQTLGAE